MTNARRSAVILVATTMAIVAIVVVAVALLADVDRYRGAIAQRMSQALGRPVELGEIRLSVLRGVALGISDVTVGALPGESGEPMLRAESVRVGVRALPLLRGRLEITSAALARPVIRLERNAQGAWNVASLVAGRRAASIAAEGAGVDTDGDGRPPPESGAAEAIADGSGESFSIDRLTFEDARLLISDAALGPSSQLALADLDLELADVAVGETVRFTAGAGVGDAEGRIRAEGTAGPLGSNDEPLVVQAQLTLAELGADGVVALARLAGIELPFASAGANGAAGRLDAVSGTVELDSTWPQRTAARGALDLGRVAVAPRAGTGKPIEVDVASRFEIAAENGIDRLRIPALEIDVDDTTLSIAGSVESAGGDGRRLDLALRPVQLQAERLQAFIELAFPDVPFAISSPQPVKIEGRIRGIARPGERPPVEARVRVADLRFDHDALALPLEHLSADVELVGESLVAEGFSAVIGESDLDGKLRVDGWAEPRVGFELASRRANLDQLFGILGGERGRTPSGATTEASGMLDRVEAAGRFRIDQASWGEIEASEVTATMRLHDGVVTLDPFTAGLYSGRFSGRVNAWPERSPLPFELAGRAENVRVDQFLSQALGLAERLDGRFSGTLEASGSAGEWEQVARSLRGRGEMRIEEGRVRSFPLLRTVAEISGVFGEETLQEIATRLADSATQFAVLRGAFRVDAGALSFDELVLESKDFTLRGEGAVDLVSAALRGDAAMIFSEELSERMREEGSRAGELFANADTGRIALPLRCAARCPIRPRWSTGSPR
jgi:uncharacterized protein involved in outer membrane biogenesis